MFKWFWIAHLQILSVVWKHVKWNVLLKSFVFVLIRNPTLNDIKTKLIACLHNLHLSIVFVPMNMYVFSLLSLLQYAFEWLSDGRLKLLTALSCVLDFIDISICMHAFLMTWKLSSFSDTNNKYTKTWIPLLAH